MRSLDGAAFHAGTAAQEDGVAPSCGATAPFTGRPHRGIGGCSAAGKHGRVGLELPGSASLAKIDLRDEPGTGTAFQSGGAARGEDAVPSVGTTVPFTDGPQLAIGGCGDACGSVQTGRRSACARGLVGTAFQQRAAARDEGAVPGSGTAVLFVQRDLATVTGAAGAAAARTTPRPGRSLRRHAACRDPFGCLRIPTEVGH